MFEFADGICFTRAVYYNMKQIPPYKPFKDGTGGMGKFAPETGFLDLYDSEGYYVHHLAIRRGFVETMLPKLFDGGKKSYNDWRHDLYQQMRNIGFQSSQVMDAGQVDLTMLNIPAQRHGKSLHRFLGVDKDWAACHKGRGSLFLTDDELVDGMIRYVPEGHKTVKSKMGSDCGRDMERDIRRIVKVREAVGNEVGIAADTDRVFGVEDAVRFAKMAKSYGLEWSEEPIHIHDINGIRALEEMDVNQPLALGESTRISYVYETYLERGVDRLQPSVGRMTRTDDPLAIRDMCRAQGRTFSSGERLYLNLLPGCLYNEDRRIEYHEPISTSVRAHILYLPIKKGNRSYWEDGFVGNPLRMSIEKLEKGDFPLSREIYLPNQEPKLTTAARNLKMQEP